MAPTITCRESYSEGSHRFERGKAYDFREEDAARLIRGAPSAWDFDEHEIRVGGPDALVNYHEPARKKAKGKPKAKAKTEPKAKTTKTDPPPPADDGEEAGVDLDAMTVAELQSFAAAQEPPIDIGGIKGKVAIRNAIERALTIEKSGETGDDEDDEDGGNAGDDEDGEDEDGEDAGDDDEDE